jgi:hypothetical protein
MLSPLYGGLTEADVQFLIEKQRREIAELQVQECMREYRKATR